MVRGRAVRWAWLAALVLTGAACDATDERSALAPALAVEASAYAVEALESSTADLCVADAFGVDPPAARALSEVTVVYAAVHCVTPSPGQAYADSSRVATAVAVRRGSPPSVEWPGDGAEYGPSIERIFPDDLRAAAYRGFGDPVGADGRLRARYTSHLGG